VTDKTIPEDVRKALRTSPYLRALKMPATLRRTGLATPELEDYADERNLVHSTGVVCGARVRVSNATIRCKTR
jgi:hypothetical protein